MQKGHKEAGKELPGGMQSRRQAAPRRHTLTDWYKIYVFHIPLLNGCAP